MIPAFLFLLCFAMDFSILLDGLFPMGLKPLRFDYILSAMDTGNCPYPLLSVLTDGKRDSI